MIMKQNLKVNGGTIILLFFTKIIFEDFCMEAAFRNYIDYKSSMMVQ